MSIDLIPRVWNEVRRLALPGVSLGEACVLSQTQAGETTLASSPITTSELAIYRNSHAYARLNAVFSAHTDPAFLFSQGLHTLHKYVGDILNGTHTIVSHQEVYLRAYHGLMLFVSGAPQVVDPRLQILESALTAIQHAARVPEKSLLLRHLEYRWPQVATDHAKFLPAFAVKLMEICIENKSKLSPYGEPPVTDIEELTAFISASLGSKGFQYIVDDVINAERISEPRILSELPLGTTVSELVTVVRDDLNNILKPTVPPVIISDIDRRAAERLS